MTGGTGVRPDAEDGEALRRFGGDLGVGLRGDASVAHPGAEDMTSRADGGWPVLASGTSPGRA